MISLAVLLAGAFAGAAQEGASDSRPALEHEVKAAFLYNFAKFVEWPPSGNEAPAALVVGVVGNDALAAALEQTTRGKTVNGQPLVVRRIGALPELKLCQIVFVGSAEKRRVGEILAAIGNTSVLTVGETAQFARRGGIINFIEEDSKIRFEVNPDAAARSGLKISSRLLQLARVVRDGPHDR